MDYSVVMWQRDDSGGRPTTETDEGVSEKIYAPDNTYTIRELQNNTVYHITVTVYSLLGIKQAPPSHSIPKKVTEYTVTYTRLIALG